MSIQGWYYLHQNGSLIYKPHAESAADIRDSDFAICMWPMDQSNRMGAWNIAVEGLALGANRSRVAELAEKWHLTNEDADQYASRIGVSVSMDGDKWCAMQPGFINLQESHAGFGDTKLEALTDLAKRAGIQSGCMWRQDFPALMSELASGVSA